MIIIQGISRSTYLRKILAWGVHLFTASGALWGFLAILAIQRQQWKEAILWMAIAVFVDGVDGGLSRLLEVKFYAAGLDGALLDNIIDYFNYVVVAALFVVYAALVPAPVRLLSVAIILLTSAYQFCQMDAKTDDHYFKGFPSYWNLLVVYMLLMRLHPWVNFGVILLCGILVFIPIKYVYPSRTRRQRTLTLVLTYLWAGLGVIMILLYPAVPDWMIALSLMYVVYYIAISLAPLIEKK